LLLLNLSSEQLGLLEHLATFFVVEDVAGDIEEAEDAPLNLLQLTLVLVVLDDEPASGLRVLRFLMQDAEF